MTRLLTLLLLLAPSVAWAQVGFLQAVPGTVQPTCASIPSPVRNQTWCADASGGPGTYFWRVWNGTTYVTVGSGGGVTGSGTVNTVPVWTASAVLGDSAIRTFPDQSIEIGSGSVATGLYAFSWGGGTVSNDFSVLFDISGGSTLAAPSTFQVAITGTQILTFNATTFQLGGTTQTLTWDGSWGNLWGGEAAVDAGMQNGSLCWGSVPTCSGSTVVALGITPTVSGDYSVALQSANVSGRGSFAFGGYNAVAAVTAETAALFNLVKTAPYTLADTETFAVNATTVRLSAPTTSLTGGTANGQSANIKVLTEETTILAAAFTDTAAQFPAGSTSLGCTVRVTTVIPTATTFNTGVAGDLTRYATGTSTASTSTGGSAVFSPYATATSVRITPNVSPGAATGRVRVTCPYVDVTPASS